MTYPTSPLPPEMEYFTLTAPPGTKIWRDPGRRDIISAPTIYTALREPLIVAEVTITANWEMEWDQAGLVIFAGIWPGEEEDLRFYSCREGPRRRWVKAGLEFSNGMLHVSTAAAVSPSGADLSLAPLPGSTQCETPYTRTRPNVRIKLERMGDALWVWYQQPQASCCTTCPSPAEASTDWAKVREVAGFFWGIDSKMEVWVGCYASRPMPMPMPERSNAVIDGRADDERSGLWVEFEDLEII